MEIEKLCTKEGAINVSTRMRIATALDLAGSQTQLPVLGRLPWLPQSFRAGIRCLCHSSVFQSALLMFSIVVSCLFTLRLHVFESEKASPLEK